MNKFTPLQILFYECNQWRPVICLLIGLALGLFIRRKSKL